MRKHILIALMASAGFCSTALAGKVIVLNETGAPVENVMVSQTPVSGFTIDRSDNGYPPVGVLNRSSATYSSFTNTTGKAQNLKPSKMKMCVIV